MRTHQHTAHFTACPALLTAVLALGAALPAVAQPLPGTPVARTAQPANAAAPVTGTMPGVPGPQATPTVLARVAQQIGIRRCYAAVQGVSQRVYEGARHEDIMVDWERAAPDGAAFFSLSGLEFAGTSAVLSLSTVPGTDGGCTVLAERISSAPLACDQVARAQLAGYRAMPLVHAVTAYTDPSHTRETVVLIDAPPSCVIVRRQVQYRWGGQP